MYALGYRPHPPLVFSRSTSYSSAPPRASPARVKPEGLTRERKEKREREEKDRENEISIYYLHLSMYSYRSHPPSAAPTVRARRRGQARLPSDDLRLSLLHMSIHMYKYRYVFTTIQSSPPSGILSQHLLFERAAAGKPGFHLMIVDNDMDGGMSGVELTKILRTAQHSAR